MKGYIAVNTDFTLEDFKYEIGKEYSVDEELITSAKSFYFCANPIDAYGYYTISDNSTIIEIETKRDVVQDGTLFYTNEIKVIREFTKEEFADLTMVHRHNTGDFNSGDFNTGDSNSGWHNSGFANSGNHNTGDRNSGDCNTGNCNTGDNNCGHYNHGHQNAGNFNDGSYNVGEYNSGMYNTGHHNNGDFNSGGYNCGSRNTGYFNSTEATVRLFNYDSRITFEEFFDSAPDELWWELSQKKLSEESIEFLKNLPHFNARIFKECTGIEIK